MSYDSFATAGSVSVYLFGVGGLKLSRAKLMEKKNILWPEQKNFHHQQHIFFGLLRFGDKLIFGIVKKKAPYE